MGADLSATRRQADVDPDLDRCPVYRTLRIVGERWTILVLRDLFGPQTLIRDGVLPTEVLYRHPGFRLPFCRGPEMAERRMLEFYAADLARAPDGRWWVLSDRTESASGAGFALENRIAISGMLRRLALNWRSSSDNCSSGIFDSALYSTTFRLCVRR